MTAEGVLTASFRHNGDLGKEVSLVVFPVEGTGRMECRGADGRGRRVTMKLLATNSWSYPVLWPGTSTEPGWTFV